MRNPLDFALVLGGALAAVAAYYSVVLWQPPLREIEGPVESFFFQASNTSPHLIFGLCGIFLWSRRRRIRQALQAPPQKRRATEVR